LFAFTSGAFAFRNAAAKTYNKNGRFGIGVGETAFRDRLAFATE
jgi:hypothetical protein